MDERRKQQLMEGCMRIRKEIAAWLLMALWVIFSVKIAEVLLGESLPGWVEIGGMILCGVLAVASHLDNPLRHGYKLRRPRRYLLGALVILICAVLCMESGVGAGHAGTGDPCGIYLEPYLCLAGMEGRIRSGIIRRRLWRIFRMCS